MNCNEVKQYLWQIVEQPEKFDANNPIRLHLDTCPKCQQEYKILLSINSVIEDQKNTQPNPFLETRVLQKIEPKPQKGIAFVLKPLFYAAMIAVAIVFGNITARFITNKTIEKAVVAEKQNNDTVYYYVFNDISPEDYQFINNK